MMTNGNTREFNSLKLYYKNSNSSYEGTRDQEEIPKLNLQETKLIVNWTK